VLAAVCLSAVGNDGPASRPDPSLDRQREVCFPDPWPREVKTWGGEGIVLWSDAPLDGKALVKELIDARAYLRALLPKPAPASLPATTPAEKPVALAVYARPADYRRIWRRVGELYGGALPAITTRGYSCRVFCATSFETPERFAARRSVVCHEFAHVWLYRNRGLRNDGNWLTEGLAGAVQLKLHPAAGNRRDFARWLDAGRMLPLKRLMDLDRIQPKDYWQAITLVEYLAAARPRDLPAALTAFNQRRSANAIVTGVLKTDFPSIEAGWTDYVHHRASPPTTTAPVTAP